MFFLIFVTAGDLRAWECLRPSQEWSQGCCAYLCIMVPWYQSGVIPGMVCLTPHSGLLSDRLVVISGLLLIAWARLCSPFGGLSVLGSLPPRVHHYCPRSQDHGPQVGLSGFQLTPRSGSLSGPGQRPDCWSSQSSFFHVPNLFVSCSLSFNSS